MNTLRVFWMQITMKRKQQNRQGNKESQTQPIIVDICPPPPLFFLLAAQHLKALSMFGECLTYKEERLT